MIQNISNKDYHTAPGISKSDLDLIAISPAHYKAKDLRREETPAMAFGSAVHMAVFEPVEFYKTYAAMPPNLDRRTKEGKAVYESIESSGKTILSYSDSVSICGIKKSIEKHKWGSHLITGGVAEQSIFWERETIDNNGNKTINILKCRPDYRKIINNKYTIIDLKTTEDARPLAFERNAWHYRYHVQSALYIDGCTNEFREPPLSFLFLVVEKKPPYAIQIYEAGNKFIWLGREEYTKNLHKLNECLNSGVWGAYEEEVLELAPPKWAE